MKNREEDSSGKSAAFPYNGTFKKPNTIEYVSLTIITSQQPMKSSSEDADTDTTVKLKLKSATVLHQSVA